MNSQLPPCDWQELRRAPAYWFATSSTTEAMFGNGSRWPGAGLGVRAPLGAGAGAGAGVGAGLGDGLGLGVGVVGVGVTGVGTTGAAGVRNEATGDDGLTIT